MFCQGIADIDQQDSDNPQLCAEYAPFMYGYLRQLERQLAIKQDFLKVSLTAVALDPAVSSYASCTPTSDSWRDSWPSSRTS